MSRQLYLWLVPSGVVIGHVGIAAKLLPRVPALDPLARWLAHAWAIGLVATWLLRVGEVGRPPVVGAYDSALLLAVATAGAAVLWEHAGRRQVTLTPLAVLTAAAVMSHGRGFAPSPPAVAIPRWWWLVEVHAVVAAAAFAVLAVMSFFALRLVLGRGSPPRIVGSWLVLSLGIGFGLYSAMMVSGALCRWVVTGVPWSFDPVESFAMMIWFGCGALLCLHYGCGWPARRLAGWGLALFALVVLSYRGIAHLPAPWSFHRSEPTETGRP